jgi:hypothetical protein
MAKKFPAWFRFSELMAHEAGPAASEEDARTWLLQGALGPLEPLMLTERKAPKSGAGGTGGSMVPVPLFLHFQPRSPGPGGALPQRWSGEIGDAELTAARKALEAAALPLRASSLKPEPVRKAALHLLRLWSALVRAHTGSERLTGILCHALNGGATVTTAPPTLVSMELAMRKAGAHGMIPGGTAPGDTAGVPYLYAERYQRPGNHEQGLNKATPTGFLLTTGSPAWRAVQDMYAVCFISAMEAYVTSQTRQVEYSLASTLREAGITLPFNGKTMSATSWWASVQQAVSRAAFWQQREKPYSPRQFFYPLRVAESTGTLELEEGTGVPLQRLDVGVVDPTKVILSPEWVANLMHARALLGQEAGDRMGMGLEDLLQSPPEEFMERYLRWVEEAGRAMQILNAVVTSASFGGGMGGGGGAGGGGRAPCSHCGGTTHHVNNCFNKGPQCSGCSALVNVQVGDATVQVCPTLKTAQDAQGRKTFGISGQVSRKTTKSEAAKSEAVVTTSAPTSVQERVQALQAQAAVKPGTAAAGGAAQVQAQGVPKPVDGSGGAKGTPPPAGLNPRAVGFTPPNQGGGKRGH